MKLKCLMELLLKKEYVKEKRRCKIEEDVIASIYEFEYPEVLDKILDSDFDREIISISKHSTENNKFFIINYKNLEKGLLYLGKGKERFVFRADFEGLSGFDPYKLMLIINNKTKFEVIRYGTVDKYYFEICDSYLKEKRLLEELKKKEEVLDFLEKLP